MAPPAEADPSRPPEVPDQEPTLLAVPNVSEGRNPGVVAAVGKAITGGLPAEASLTGQPIKLLDVHFDRDHGRSVFTIAGRAGTVAEAVLRCGREAIQHIDVMGHDARRGQHPHVGALDVAPVVYLRPQDRGAACAEALRLADMIGNELQVPVLLYGELTAEEHGGAGRSRAELRRGGPAALAARLQAGAEGAANGDGPLRPDFGPSHLHATAGATLVAARPPLVAFNLQLDKPATLADAGRIAVLIREGGPQGMLGLRAIAVELSGGIPQVSMNVERPFELPLVDIYRAVARHARVASAQLVGLAPKAAFDGFPADVPIPGFDPDRHLIENALAR
jgi:glutamate formiminotransferase/glutamate formiminotransferase/formiminotetrahydrofolate cyclodeaminase